MGRSRNGRRTRWGSCCCRCREGWLQVIGGPVRVLNSVFMSVRVQEFVTDKNERARKRGYSYSDEASVTGYPSVEYSQVREYFKWGLRHLPAQTWKMRAPESAATMSLVDAFHSRTSLTPNWAMLALKPRSSPSIDEKNVVYN